MIAANSAHHPDSVTAALGIHLIVFCAVVACFAFGLHALLQPSRAPNAGLAAYKPPPGTIIKYGDPSPTKSVPEPRVPVVEPIAPVALIESETATTNRSTPEREQNLTVTAPSRPRTAKRLIREVRVETPKPRVAVCIPAYDSSGAQTRPCG
jgi:hypothetical protein